MNQPSQSAPRVEIAYICHIRKPDGTIRCNRPQGHQGSHENYYVGETDASGIRPVVSWPRRLGETQAD
jgi:hypothetical protein